MAVGRRTLLVASVVAGSGMVVCGCPATGGLPRVDPVLPGAGSAARLSARPSGGTAPDAAAPGPGLHALPSASGRDALLYVPPDGGRSGRLVLALHGAGADARGGLAPLLPFADDERLLLLAPASQDSTWDALLGRWGPDVRRIDEALGVVLTRFPVDPGILAVSGFSDGASYALSLGLANGDLFGAVVAFSPGFVPPAPRVGAPRVFVAHGTQDRVLPIDRTTRRIVPRLRAEGIPTHVREFDGPHLVPEAIAAEAVEWLVP